MACLDGTKVSLHKVNDKLLPLLIQFKPMLLFIAIEKWLILFSDSQSKLVHRVAFRFFGSKPSLFVSIKSNPLEDYNPSKRLN